MTDLRSAAQQALEALEDMLGWQSLAPQMIQESAKGRAYALRAALAEPVQEPVAIVGTQEDTWKGYGGQWAPPGPPIKTVHMLRELPEGMLLYTAPRVPLAEWQINDLMADIDPEDMDSWSFRQGVYAAEKHHGVRK